MRSHIHEEIKFTLKAGNLNGQSMYPKWKDILTINLQEVTIQEGLGVDERTMLE